MSGTNSAQLKYIAGQTGLAVGMDQAGPRAQPFQRLTMAKLFGKQNYRNPEAARLAQHYVPLILAGIQKSLDAQAQKTSAGAGLTPKRNPELQAFADKLEASWPKFMAEEAERRSAQQKRTKNSSANGYQPEKELSDEELRALEELPL